MIPSHKIIVLDLLTLGSFFMREQEGGTGKYLVSDEPLASFLPLESHLQVLLSPYKTHMSITLPLS